MDIRDTEMAESSAALVAKEADDEPREAGPGEVGGTVDTKKSELITLDYDEELIKQMWEEVRAAEERLKDEEIKWDILLKEYIPIVKASGTPEDVRTNSHFANVHTKIGQLFYQEPELILSARDPGPANDQRPNPQQPPPLPPTTTLNPMQPPPPPPVSREDIISVKQAYLNYLMGRTEIKALRLMDEVLFDNLAWSGISFTKLGYNCYMKDVSQPKMVPAPPPPMPQMPGAVLGLQNPTPQTPPEMIPHVDPLTGKPTMETVPVPVHEEYYWRRFSPKRGLFNADLKSTRFDEDARWVGMIFFLSERQIVKKYKINKDEVRGGADDDRCYEHESDKKLTKKKLYKCYELWMKASHYTDEVHPQAINQMVLVEGLEDKPVVWRLSPDQDFDEATGKLTKDSLIGFPIRICSLRDLADSPFPPADSAITNNATKELNTYRSQNIALRDAALGTQLIDGDALDENDRKKINAGTKVRQIVLKGGALREGADKVIAQAGQIKGTQDMYRGAEILTKDMQRMLGISDPQAGASEDTVRSATETATVAAGSRGRNDKEMGRAITFYLEGVRMIDQLVMRYATDEDYVEVTGEDGQARMMAWSKEHVSGRFLYDISPDSQLRPDSEAYAMRLLKAYNILAPDPLCNRVYFARRIARALGLDPFKATLPPPPPMPGMPPGMLPPMGGATQSSPVNKHEATNSGNRQNEPGAENFRGDKGAGAP